MGDTLGATWNPNNCRVYTNSHSGNNREMEFGDPTDGDTEILILFGCNTLQKCVWEGAGYGGVFGDEMNMIAGFHGWSVDTAANEFRITDYAEAGRYNGVGDYWLDSQVVWNSGVNTDQCPTVLIWGSSSTVRQDFFDSGGLQDYYSTGVHNGSTFFSLSGCDPPNGEVL